MFKALHCSISEGGNVSSQSTGWHGAADAAAEELDLKIHNRDFMVSVIRKLLTAQNKAFNSTYNRPIWNPKLLKSGQMFSGSSLHFLDVENIDTNTFLNKLKKDKIGDIDTQVDQSIKNELTNWLHSVTGHKIGNGTLLGFNSSLSSIWLLDDPQVKIQIDYELGPYDPETESPTEWFSYSHSSHYDDLSNGIKGVFHKYINRALTHAQSSEKYIAKVLKKSVKISDEPETTNDYSFAVTSAQGGGMSKKYKPFINPDTGEPMTKNGIPVMQELAPKDRDYIQNLDQQFEITYGRPRSQKDKNLQSSFVGTIQLMNKSFTPEQNTLVAEAFLNILFGPGAQMITKNDPERDRNIKFTAVDAMILGNNTVQPLTVSNAAALRQQAIKIAMEYADQYNAKKSRSDVSTEVAEDTEAHEQSKPEYARQGIKHLYNRLPDGRVSRAELSNTEFLNIAKELSENNGTLNGMAINLKVDGAGIRFGKDQVGRPFMMTSKVTTPLYSTDVGYFTNYGREKGQSHDALDRTTKYDDALKIITKSKFIKSLPNDTIVQAEMLYNPMAHESDQGLTFVNIPYDPKKLGKQMTLIPFLVKEFKTGNTRIDSNKIISQLVAASTQNIKIISNSLDHKDIDVSQIIDPILDLNPTKKENTAAFDNAKQKLSNAIIDSTKLKGKNALGNTIEGIVVNLPSGKMFKVTSQQMKQVMSTKKSPTTQKTAVVAIGSFVGHIGHEQLWNYTLDKAKKVKGDPYLFIGAGVGINDPIPPNVKVETWHKLYPEYANNISTITHTGGSLLQKIKHELINPKPGQPPRYDNIIIMVGEDQAGLNIANALMKTVTKFPGYEHVRVSLETTPRGTGMSFTKLRDVLKNPTISQAQQYAVWAHGFNEAKLGQDWILYLMDLARKGMKITNTTTNETKVFNALIRPTNEQMLPKSSFSGSDKNKLGPAAHLKGSMKRPAKQGDLVGGMEEDWQKVNKSDKTDGMSSKAVKAYRRENPGSKLKTAVTKKPSKIKKGSSDDKRRKSFCARMSGMKKAHASAKTKRDPDSPINKALRRWNCESIEDLNSLIESLDYSEYNDEAGMAKSNLITASRAIKGLLDTIQNKDNLPEWAQEKIAKAEMMLVGVWDYILSQKELGINPKITAEEKQRLDPKCWKGYKKEGTKVKGNVRVNKCVPINEDIEKILSSLIDKIITNETI